MLLVDTRRLTGPNLLSRAPLVLVELALDSTFVLADVVRVYLEELAKIRVALGFSPEVVPIVRAHVGGAVIAYEAPIDQMLACAEMSEWAANRASAIFGGQPAPALEETLEECRAILERDLSPRKVALAREAKTRDLPFLWDDSEVTLGTGHLSVSFSNAALPDVAEVAWDKLGAIPIALVTGTNGKTTSARLLARVAHEAGRVVGGTSSDAITVGTETLEEGDWTGPAAARVVLRRRDVEIAILETARGGILRRGLAIESCDAALLTNVSDDHLGLYGIDDLEAMMHVKGIVARAVRDSGTVILNAKDRALVAFAPSLAPQVTFFADLDAHDAKCDAAAAVVKAHRASGKEAVFTRDGAIVCARGDTETILLRVDEVPITFGGAARYNVENVLGVIATARALGLDDGAIVRAVRAFDTADNPGRGELLERRGVRVFLDFGHNPGAVRATMSLVDALRKARPGKLTVVTGSPGDRNDLEIEDIARAIFEARPDRVLVRELSNHLRGREPGAVPSLFRNAFRDLGLPESAFALAASETDALRHVFTDAREGDFVALLVHLDDEEVHAFLDAQG